MLTIEELDLLWFFEVEPEFLYSDTSWEYNESIYKVEKENKKLLFQIQPSYKDVRIVFSDHQVDLIDINARMINEIKLLKETSRALLRIEINDDHFILIQVKPQISIFQKMDTQRFD